GWRPEPGRGGVVGLRRPRALAGRRGLRVVAGLRPRLLPGAAANACDHDDHAGPRDMTALRRVRCRGGSYAARGSFPLGHEQMTPTPTPSRSKPTSISEAVLPVNCCR